MISVIRFHSQMKPLKEKSDATGEHVDKTAHEENKDYYATIEPTSRSQMDVVDAELLERFLQLLEETSGSDDVSYDDLLSKSGDNARPQNASAGN